MRKIWEWIKNNKLTAGLILVVAYLLLRDNNYSMNTMVSRSIPSSGASYDMAMEMEAAPAMLDGFGGGGGGAKYAPMPVDDYVPPSDTPDRMMTKNSNMSLLVQDVQKSLDEIQAEAESRKGYVVNVNIRSPEGLSTGNITIRVPSEQLNSMMAYLRSNAVRVVSENISGKDITDQFEDTAAHLATMEKTIKIFEDMLDKATKVDEILRVQREIRNMQQQIDSLKGRLKYMEASASTSLISLTLSTDEYELPYAPDRPWRPSIVFKYATRSLINHLRSLGSTLIWLGVYSVLWVPALVIFIVVRKVWKKKKAEGSLQE